MKKLILIVVISLFCGNAFSQVNPQKEIERFFEIYKGGDTSTALDTLFSTSIWFQERAKDNIEQIKIQLDGYSKQMGEVYGYEQLIARPIGDHLLHFTYFVFFDRQPLRFNFIFYKAKDEWAIFHFKYDDRISDDVYENSWYYFLDQNR